MSAFFDGDNRLMHSIDASDCSPCRGAQSSAFYDTQGRKYDLPDGTTRMTIDLYVPSDWATAGRRMAGFWGTAVDDSNATVDYPIIEFASLDGNPRFRGWESVGSGDWVDMGLPTGFTYDAWYRLEIELVGSEWVYTVGDLTLSVPTEGSVKIVNVILQGHNNVAGVTYDIYWDNFVASATTLATDNCDPSPAVTYSDSVAAGACAAEQTITRTWTATDDCGNATSCAQTITVVDTTPPVLSACPADITVPADAEFCTAEVVYTPPTATDNCDAAPDVVCDGPVDSIFPLGPTVVTCTATDDCGNASSCTFTVTVEDVNEMVVNVELDGSFTGSFDRCITFDLADCGGSASETVEQVLTFNNGVATGTVDVPCGLYTCITARDKLHTLRHEGTLATSGTQYTASFTGAAALVGGNFNDDPYVDILDFGLYSMEYSANYGAADTTCATPAPHADASGDGIVNTADFSFVQNNFLEFSDPPCCGAKSRMADGGPVTEISVTELRRRGLGEMVVADLNGDGVLNQLDVVAFMQGARPQPAPKPEVKPRLQDRKTGARDRVAEPTPIQRRQGAGWKLRVDVAGVRRSRAHAATSTLRYPLQRSSGREGAESAMQRSDSHG